MISERENNCFSGAKMDVAVGFVPFCGIKTIYEKLGLTFSRKICKLLHGNSI